MREEAMVQRKERYEKNQNQQVETVAEIAAKLKTTSMIKGTVFFDLLLFISTEGKDSCSTGH